MRKRLLSLMLAALLLAGCSTPAETTPSPETTSLPETTPPPETTLPPQTTQPPETTGTEVLSQGTIRDTPGMVAFYMGDTPFYCGQPVAGLLGEKVHIYGDMEALVQPLRYSEEIRLRYPNEQGEYQNLYFSAVNPTDQPLAVKDCLIYSLAVNCEAGHRFAFDNGDFVTGQSTDLEILALWGEPTTQKLNEDEKTKSGGNYRDMVYYRPFSYLQIVTRAGVVDQVRACHNAYLYPELSQQTAPGTPSESDSLLLLSRYMDIAPYLGGGKGSNTPLELFVTIQGERIDMGIRAYQLPQPWKGIYEDAVGIMSSGRYMYSQFPNQEGFLFGNTNAEQSYTFYHTKVVGIHAFNPAYCNRGLDQSGYRGFDYSGINHTATIEQVIQALGQPYEIIPENTTGWCFVWFHYRSEAGDTLRLKVDPETNQIMELRLEQKNNFTIFS